MKYLLLPVRLQSDFGTASEKHWKRDGHCVRCYLMLERLPSHDTLIALSPSIAQARSLPLDLPFLTSSGGLGYIIFSKPERPSKLTREEAHTTVDIGNPELPEAVKLRKG